MNTKEEFNKFEQRILLAYMPICDFALEFESQVNAVGTYNRDFSGAGVQTNVTLVGSYLDVPTQYRNCVLEGVWLDGIDFLNEIAITTIFFTDGRLDLIEVSACGENWPLNRLPVKFYTHTE